MPIDVAAHFAASVVPRVLDAIAQRHTPAILRALLRAPQGFDSLVGALGISRSTLTARLSHLIEEGCVTRTERGYALTERGRALFGVLFAMSSWDEEPTGFIHTRCGAPLSVEVVCTNCGVPMRARDVVVPDTPRAPALPSRGVRTRGLAHAAVHKLDTETILSDKWTARIVALAFFGVTRFLDMQSLLVIAPNVLAERLERLVEHGVLERRLYEERPPRSAYFLTMRGKALYGLVLAMIAWGDGAYRADVPLQSAHRVCGQSLGISFACTTCRAHVTSDAIAPI